MTAVVYARVSEPLKQALHAHAATRGLTLTAAVVELLDHGLEAIATRGSLAQRERALARARSELAQTQARLRQAELRLQAAREREQATAQTTTALAARARQKLTLCPQCRQPVNGYDLLVSGHCPNPSCTKELTSLLTPTRGGLDPNQYLTLIGAVGVLVGSALATTKQHTS